MTKDKRGKRYDSDFKQFALSLYLLNPRNYKELLKNFALPSIRSLQLFTKSWNIEPGINDKIFESLAIKLLSLPAIERHCILCIDEMCLKSHLFYNVSQDNIIGFQDTGYEKSQFAKSAIVIIAENWKLPLCYYFIETTCQSNVLKHIIFYIIIKLEIVHALITDMGSNFIQLSRALGISKENSIFFLVNDEKVFYTFDTSQ